MKVMLTKNQALWIRDHVADHLDFNDFISFGSIMYKFGTGAYRVSISIDLLTSSIRACIDRDLTKSIIFYHLCHKLDNATKKKDEKQYCFLFDSNHPMKIPSIKALRDLFRNPAFVDVEKGFVYDDSLRFCKDSIESNCVLGPYNAEDARIVKSLLSTAPVTMEIYKKQKTFKSFYINLD